MSATTEDRTNDSADQSEPIADRKMLDLIRKGLRVEAERDAALAAIDRVRRIADRVAADPSNATDELWVYAIRNALDGDQ